MRKRTEREEDLQVEIERLKSWLHKIQNVAYMENQPTDINKIEWAAREALVKSNCAAHCDWESKEEWPTLGKWPPNTIPDSVLAD